MQTATSMYPYPYYFAKLRNLRGGQNKVLQAYDNEQNDVFSPSHVDILGIGIDRIAFRTYGD